MSAWLHPRRHPDPIEAGCGCAVLIVVAVLAIAGALWLVAELLERLGIAA